MKRSVKTLCAAAGLGLALALPASTGASTKWICTVEGVPTTFVTAGDAALHGLTQADSRAGTVFETQFGEENCHVVSDP